jgi:flagella basal body P-ring formation protein FlgA
MLAADEASGVPDNARHLAARPATPRLGFRGAVRATGTLVATCPRNNASNAATDRNPMRSVHQAVKQPSIRTALHATLLMLCVAGVAGAAERQSLSALRAAVIEFVSAEHAPDAHLQVIPDALDPRLRLAACDDALQTFWAPGSARAGQVSVGVRCASQRPWKLYVPARVELMQPVVVAARALVRGQRLSAQDLRIDARDVGALHDGAVRDPAQIIGYLMTRPLAAGRVLVAGALEAPTLVERGRRVRMAVDGVGVHITMTGLALENGALGQTVRVRNPASQRVVEGVVVGPARIRLRSAGLAVPPAARP